MSRKKGTTHRLRDNRVRDGWARDDDVLVQCSWARTEADLDEAKQRTHDRVIVALGAHRTGGVRWMIQQPPEAYKTLATMAADGGESYAAEVTEPISTLLETEGGYLVVAMAPGARA